MGTTGLYIPGSAESSIKLNRGFTLAVGGEVDFVAEIDLMKSIHNPEGLDPDFIMLPTIRLLDRIETGSIAGEVPMVLATQLDRVAAVYLYDSGVAADGNEDDDGMNSVDSIASSMIAIQYDSRYLYEIGPVIAGSYDVAFSCDADDPQLDETLNYVLSPAKPVAVLANQQSIVNF